MRFRQRTKVDLPQPEGPITAVTCFSAICRLMPFSTSAWPKYACKSVVRILGTTVLTETSSQRDLSSPDELLRCPGFEILLCDEAPLIEHPRGSAPAGARRC